MTPMNGFVAALKADLYVAVRSNSVRLLVLLPSLAVMTRAIVVRLSETGQQAREALLGQGGFDAVPDIDNAWGHFVDSFSIGLTLLTLTLVAYAAWAFSGERDTGAIRHVLIRRAGRGATVMSKLAVVHLLALAGFLLMTLAIVVVTALLWDFGPVVEDGFELIGTAEIRREVLLGLGLALIPLPAAIAMGVLVSVCAQSATQAVTTALGLTLALDVFKGALGDNAYYLYATFQPSLIDQSYLQDVSRLVRGYSDVLIDNRVLELNQWVAWPQFALFVIAALLVVRRKKL